jgi:DNA-binding response OmpR family regulator
MSEQITLLLIDDDEDDRGIFMEAVNEVDENITCVGAADCEEALKFLRDEANKIPDYIFLDLRMPRISGKKCLEEIRKEERLVNIPVIIYTTSTDEKEAIELKSLGAVHFISKPTDPNEIYYLVSAVLGEKWS